MERARWAKRGRGREGSVSKNETVRLLLTRYLEVLYPKSGSWIPEIRVLDPGLYPKPGSWIPEPDTWNRIYGRL